MIRCLSCAGPDGFHEPHCQQERDSLRVENARLQARVEEAEQHDCGYALQKEALNNMWGLHHGSAHKGHLNRETCPATSCQEARAAIEEED